jgi:hypothetical protein
MKRREFITCSVARPIAMSATPGEPRTRVK